MQSYLCLTVRFLQPFAHGRRNESQPEFPPSPLRLFQALVAAAAGRWNERIKLSAPAPALLWLENQPEPEIVAPEAVHSQNPYRLYVPDNVSDKVAASWARGGDATIAGYRTEKVVSPVHLAGDTIHYLYPLLMQDGDIDKHFPVLQAAARSITHLGWGIDIAAGDATRISADEASKLSGCRWQPATSDGMPLRVPLPGTLDNLTRKHNTFLNRLTESGFRPVPSLSTFRTQRYHRTDQPQQRPYRVFELRRLDGRRFRYPQSRLVHIAGMVRHLAKEKMLNSPPADVDDAWVETYVVGHEGNKDEHRQLSYLPLPSIGHVHADPGIRRVILAASPGEDAWLNHLCRRLAGERLQPEYGNEFDTNQEDDLPILVPVQRDNIASFYTRPARTWASVTPVILPGHDDHKPQKTRKLIERALQQSGIEQSCSFEWSAFSRFPQSLSAHKYDKAGKPVGYIRPKHLLTQTAVHLTLRFDAGLEVPGPIAIGAGRHCGLGLFAAAVD